MSVIDVDIKPAPKVLILNLEDWNIPEDGTGYGYGDGTGYGYGRG
jgi:hypothetical protein